MNIAGWEEVCTFTKTRNRKLRDTFRIYINELGWCKAHSDKHGKDYYFESKNALDDKLAGLRQVNYIMASGDIPVKIISRYAAFIEEI